MSETIDELQKNIAEGLDKALAKLKFWSGWTVGMFWRALPTLLNYLIFVTAVYMLTDLTFGGALLVAVLVTSGGRLWRGNVVPAKVYVRNPFE